MTLWGSLILPICVCANMSSSNLCGCLVFVNMLLRSVGSVRDIDDVVVTEISSSLDGVSKLESLDVDLSSLDELSSDELSE